MATFSRIKTWVSNEVLTATDLNSEFDNIITHMTPTGLEDASANISAMQTQTDPGGVGSESLATTLLGELQRLRYMLSWITGKAQWYDHTGRNLGAGSLAIQTADIADGSVTGLKFADGSVTTAKLANSSVDATKLLPYSSRSATAIVPIYQTPGTSGGTDYPVPSSSVIFPTFSGRPVKIWLSPYLVNQSTFRYANIVNGSDPASVRCNVFIMRDGNPIAVVRLPMMQYLPQSTFLNDVLPVTTVSCEDLNPPTGNTTYSLVVNSNLCNLGLPTFRINVAEL